MSAPKQQRWQRIGVYLLIGSLGATLALPQQSAGAQDGTGVAIHVVAWGDSLMRIALRYGVSQQAILTANNLEDPDRIYAGQELIIPEPSAAVPSTQPQSATHIVQAGETLFRIGLRYGVSVNQLMAANGLTNPNQIYVGQSLVIPPPAGAAQEVSPSETASGGPDEAITTHVVQPGETLAKIAGRYGVFVSALVQTNNLANPSVIYVGQVLVIPRGTGPGEGGPQPSAPANASAAYIVQRGDTLLRIALRHNMPLSQLLEMNGLSNADRIYVGQQLVVPRTLAIEPAATPAPATAPAPTLRNGKQIVVDLSEQRVYAYEDAVLQRYFVVSTGLPATPTVTGNFAVYIKYTSQRMTGPGYDLPGVPWVMYFYRGYGFHGTYWHNNFGQPMSHGCVNMRTSEASWLYEWAPVGTPVLVQE